MLKVGRNANAPSFMVMDVVAAANARQAARSPGDPHVIHMEVGQPSTGAPAGAVRAVQAALASGRPLGYTEASAMRRCASASLPITPTGMGSMFLRGELQ